MKRIASIQDISCIGKCSQTIALPIISAMGIEVSVIPTSILSAHTMFPGFTYNDLIDEMKPIMKHWKTLNVHFDGILTGYLGSIQHIRIIEEFYDMFTTDDTTIVVDPVFGDNGKIYTGFDDEYANEIKSLCNRAHIIVPNVTEAAIMSGIPYETDYDMTYIHELLDKLTATGAPNIIITSIRRDNDNGIIARLSDGETFEYFRPHIDSVFHGTGDLFTSTLTGALIRGLDIRTSIRLAVDYTALTLERTLQNNTHNWYGIDFETTIPDLINNLTSALATLSALPQCDLRGALLLTRTT